MRCRAGWWHFRWELGWAADCQPQSQAPPFWGLVMLCLIVGLIVYSLLLVFVLPASYTLFIAQGEHFAAGLDFSGCYKLMRGGPVPYFMVFIGGIVCGFITFLGLAGCIIGVILTSTYSLTVLAHLYGQAYLRRTRRV